MTAFKFQCIVFATVACHAFSSFAQAEDLVNLTPEWTQGTTFYVEFTWDNDDLNKGRDYPLEGQREYGRVTYGFLHTVERVTSSGEACITLAIDRAAIRLKRGNLELFYDTDAPQRVEGLEVYGKKLEALIGKLFTITVAADGRVLPVCLPEDFALQAAPGDDMPHGEDVVPMFTSLLPVVMQSYWGQFYGAFAFKGVRVGDSWSRVIGDSSPISPVDVTWKLEQLQRTPSGRRAIVTHSGHVDEPAEWKDMNGVRMKSGPYDASGQTIIDVDSGRIVSSQEQVKARVRARNEEPRKDRPDQDPWWIDAVSTARHAIIVQTEEERNAGRGASAQR
jgi:hypothetical protein